MLNKGLLAVSAIAAVLTGFAATADAKTKIIIGVNVPGITYDDPYYEPDYLYGDDYQYRYQKKRRYPVYQEYQDNYRRLSCNQVRRSLKRRGWGYIEVQDCEGRYYSYIAVRHGRSYLLQVSSRNGAIINRERL